MILAIESGVPIVPITIYGTWVIMPKKQIFVKPGKVVLDINRPIGSSGYKRKTMDDLIKKVRNMMLESFEKGKKGLSLC